MPKIHEFPMKGFDYSGSGTMQEKQQLEARKYSLLRDYLRCPRCCARGLILEIEHHFKSQNDYHLWCVTCGWTAKNPFEAVWAFCRDDPKYKWLQYQIECFMQRWTEEVMPDATI